jgi:phosphoribosylpyrophosphate synthetase
VPGSLYTVLMGYKESSVDEARRRFARLVFRLFADFFVIHRRCLAEATAPGVDLVLPVPSSARPGNTPLEAVEGLGALCVSSSPGARWAPRVLRRADGDIGHMRPNAQAFAVPDSWLAAVKGSRVVLVDDTYVSGARSQSAAAALRRAGARAVTVVPLGRVIRPERFAAHAAFMNGHPAAVAARVAAAVAAGDGHRDRCRVAQTGAGMG